MADERRTDERAEGQAGPADRAPGAGGEDGRATALPPRLERWRRRSATGAIMTGFALGLQEVFEPDTKEPSIMLEASGDPPGDLPVDAELDGLGARHSVVRIRPWLLDGSSDAAAPDEVRPGGATGEGQDGDTTGGANPNRP